MKQLTTLTNIIGAIATLTLMAACQTVATNDAELAASKKEFLLAQSGFKVITVTTPQQQQAVSGLAQGRVSAVKYNKKTYYVFPTGTKDNSPPINRGSRRIMPAIRPARRRLSKVRDKWQDSL